MSSVAGKLARVAGKLSWVMNILSVVQKIENIMNELDVHHFNVFNNNNNNNNNSLKINVWLILRFSLKCNYIFALTSMSF